MHNSLYNDRFDVRFDFSKIKPCLLHFDGLRIGEYEELDEAIDASHKYQENRMSSFKNSDDLIAMGEELEAV